MFVAQGGIGPLLIRSRVNLPPKVSDENFRDKKPTDITDMTLKWENMIFGVCMCELEQQPKENL